MDYFNKNIGEPTEDAVQAAVEAAFASDFVFRAPRHEGDKEVTDVLALFDDVALVIQAKAQSGTRDSLTWAKKNLAKALKQTRGAIRVMRSGRLTQVKNERRGELAFDPSQYPFMYGLIVLHHESPPYKAEDLVGNVAKQEFPVHVLSFRDFVNLARYLDTPGDLIDYLEHRTDVLLPTLEPMVHEEQQVFAYFVEKYEEIHALRAGQRGDDFTVADGRPHAEHLRGLIAGTVDPHPGRLIDLLIDRVHDVDPGLGRPRGLSAPPPGGSDYSKIAAAIAAIPRARRIALGRKGIDLAKRSAETRTTRHFLTYSSRRDDCLLYMVSPLPEQKRAERRDFLLELTALAKAYCRVTRAIGIATTTPGTGGGAEDYVLMERPEPEPPEEVQKLGKDAFGDFKKRLIDRG